MLWGAVGVETCSERIRGMTSIGKYLIKGKISIRTVVSLHEAYG